MDSISHINLYSPTTQEDWYPTYRILRDEAPVYRVPNTNMFVVTRYDDVLHVLRHQEIFRTGGAASRSPEARAVYAAKGWERAAPLGSNPPEHRWYRDVVDGYFDSNGAAHWQPFIEATISDLILAMKESGGPVDFVESFALPLPVRVITRILGFPADDIERLKAWSSAWVLPFSGPLSSEQEVWVAGQVVEFQNYINEWIERKRSNPQDDVISGLVHATYNDERPLTNHEIITIVDHLYIGGNETTTFALTSALWLMLREPRVYAALRDNRELVEHFLEESMRLESPTQGLFRVAADDTELNGVAIPRGSTIHIRYGAANRDERVFPNPDVVDLDRKNVRRHMAFSLGEHHCPGSGLSRLEQRLALHAILDHLPDLELTDDNDFTHMPGFVLRALKRLSINWNNSGGVKLVNADAS